MRFYGTYNFIHKIRDIYNLWESRDMLGMDICIGWI